MINHNISHQRFEWNCTKFDHYKSSNVIFLNDTSNALEQVFISIQILLPGARDNIIQAEYLSRLNHVNVENKMQFKEISEIIG